MDPISEKEAFDKLDSTSDEEFMNMPLPSDDGETYESGEESTEDYSTDTEDLSEEDPEESGESEETEELDNEEGENEDTPNPDLEDDSEDADSDDNEDTTDTSDADTQLAKLFAPFRANGRDMSVDSVEEAVQLMQMGANFNKKMSGLKPNLKLMKMLDNNGLLDENKINYLIDLDKKNPSAIAKLVADSDFNSYEHEAGTDYTPNTYNVSDSDMQLEDTLSEIRDSKAYPQTLNIISDKWDEASKNVLLNNPSAIKQINEHVELGIYAQIEARMDKDRMLGNLTGMSDLEAYKATGDKLASEGAFANMQSTPANKPANSKAKKPKVDSETRKRKLAASSTKSTPTKKANLDYNPLEMDDAESEKAFQELMGTKFI